MAPPSPRTDFVRRLLDSRPLGPDDYAGDMLQIERALASGGRFGIASGMAFLNLACRYPREYEAIRQELGAGGEAWAGSEERIERLLEERLRLAEGRSGTRKTFL